MARRSFIVPAVIHGHSHGITAWTARTGGTQVTDLLDSGGAATSTLTGSGYDPLTFSGPADGSGALWLQLSDAAGVRRKITADDFPLADVTAVSVKSYGAKGDGTTDDTAAIQAAISAVGTSGGVVFFPPGTYRITSALTVTTNGVTLEGAGVASTIQSGSATQDVILIGNGSATVAHCAVRSLHLNNSSGQKTAGTGIKLNKCFKTWLSDLVIEQQYRSVHVLNSTQTYLRDSDIRNTSESGLVYEADLNSGYDMYVNNVVLDNPNVTSNGNGFHWAGGENFVVHNCDVIRFTTGLLVSPSAGRECRFGFFTAAEFDTASDNCVHITNSGTGNTVGLTFTNCWAGTATNYGVLMDRPGGGIVQGVRWVGGKVFHNGLAGFRMAGGQDLHISDCDIIGNSQTVSAARHGVEIGGAWTNWSVQNCRIGGGFGQGNTQGYAINIDAGAADYYLITGNDCSTGNNNTPTINDGGTGTHKVVTNNL